ncbi:MAG: thiamine phosphate synthase [Desulfovibrio sp.]|nr:thiamine phosphate synthase [Desulfovibrio sp.]
MPRILPGETPLYALTDSRLSLGRSLREVATALLEAGIKILQYREKKAPMARKYEECKLLRALTRDYDACLVVNDHIELALACECDGLHVGQDDLPLPALRRLAPGLMIGISTHSPAQALQARADGADYIGVGPIFATQTKEDVVAPVGFEYLDWVAGNLDLPFVAIGGIKAHNIFEVARHGANCCALVSELVGAPDIGAKVAQTRAAMAKGIAARNA